VLLFAARREMIGQVVQCCDKEATENNFASWTVQSNWKRGILLQSITMTEWLELNGAHQHLIYADYGNLLGKNINTMKKNTNTVVDVEVNAKKSKYGICSFPITRLQDKIVTQR
jgi:hypothetical protein